MKRRRILLILIGSVAAVTLAIFIWPRDREPEYDGVSLSQWLQRYKDNKPQATEAIQHIGTNAFPFLLHWIQYEKPSWRNFLNHLHSRLPSSVQNSRALHWLLYNKAERCADLSVEAFWILRSDPGWTTNDVNELLRLARAENPRDTRRRAMKAIANISGYATSDHFIVQ